MHTLLPPLPDLETLASGLTSALREAERADGPVTVLEREPNPYAGNFRSEIVTCRLSDGGVRRLFCRYEARVAQSWSDVAYEAEFYRRVLRPLQVPVLGFYGAHTEAATDRTWLIIDYLEDCVTLDKSWKLEAMSAAARWLGRFHAAAGRWLPDCIPSFLKVYDAEYYLGHARRMLRYMEETAPASSWLPGLCRRFEELLGPVWESRRTVVHGDFYAHNILVHNESVYPIDWEMAGVDLGELDLACLTDGWPEEFERECEIEYQRARWPGGAPADFAGTLAAARLCLCFYEMSRPGWTADPQAQWYGRKARALAKQWELL